MNENEALDKKSRAYQEIISAIIFTDFYKFLNQRFL
jgi:hypothetical protein